MLKISLIIPAYNVEDYITRCIQSIAQQDLAQDQYEAIIINDGSTDHTLHIIHNTQQNYPFLKVITTPNQGLSMARNTGIQAATGKYILFVDSDDSIQPNVLGQIYSEMENNNLDMMLMNYQRLNFQQESSDIFFRLDRNTRVPVKGVDFLASNSYPPMVWSYAYKREFIEKHSLTMRPMWHEDEEFTPRAIYLSNRIKYFPILFYNYYQNKASYMESYKEENFLYLIQAMASLKHFIKQYKEDIKGNEYFDNHIAGLLIFYLKKNIKEKYNNQKVIIKEIKKGGLLPLRPQKKSFYTTLLNLSPQLFIAYYRFFRSHH